MIDLDLTFSDELVASMAAFYCTKTLIEVELGDQTILVEILDPGRKATHDSPQEFPEWELAAGTFTGCADELHLAVCAAMTPRYLD